MSLKIEPATCRFVAQCLNHYTTARPLFQGDAAAIAGTYYRLEN
jgi:hypothetical protein